MVVYRGPGSYFVTQTVMMSTGGIIYTAWTGSFY